MTEIHPLPLSDCTVWLFCRVIDNFGDAGVAWRLASSLRQETGATVHLYIDDITTLAPLNHAIDPALPIQDTDGVKVVHWMEDALMRFDDTPPPDCVIELFGCDLPPEVHMVIRDHAALWLNWEYLTAETWAENMHLLPSPQTDGTEKFFYFMGFSEQSGGLLREQGAGVRHQESGIQLSSQAENLPAGHASDSTRRAMSDTLHSVSVYLFGYTSPVWADWLKCWQDLDQPLTVSLAGKQVTAALRQTAFLPADALQKTDSVWCSGALTLRQVPFVPQAEFDAVLQAADIVVVRGEDSFVRAQWAAKPFFWHIYPQAEQAHLTKLNAFWDLVYPYFPPIIATAHRALSDELNGAHVLSAAARKQHWQDLLTNRHAWEAALQRWRDNLSAQPSAIEKLASLIREKRLK